MAEVKWIKIVVDIFDDEKIKLIEAMPDGDSIIVCWFKLLCLAGRQNNCGVMILNDRIVYTDEMLATVFRRPLQTVRLSLATFEQFGMIEIVNGAITIPNWGKHQNLDRLEKLRDYQREYHREYRKKQLPEKAESKHDRKLYINDTDIEEDIDKEEDKEKNIVGKQQRKFKPPTVEEVAEYCRERKNEVDPEKFCDYYSANGWKVGKNSMKDWKAAVRMWERNDKRNDTPDAPKSEGKQWNIQYAN